jgi:XTP/dITP diphosphohydrolase
VTTFVLATRNPHKVEELRRILGERLGEHELVAYDGPEPVEDGDSFEANALIKARAAHAWTRLPALADDSGICVDALAGAPGIHSARYAGTRDDADNVRLLLDNLRGATDRSAAFVCAAALVDDGFDRVESAEWRGDVLPAPVGEGGFGYDPVFRPEGETRSAAQLSPDEKDALSHRARAFTLLLPTLLARYGE